MWAMTSYYNPVRYKRRLSNYRIFRENLGVPLITVELSFNGQFELTEEQADILIQISGGAVLWQKERLLNVALQAVPSSCNKVAWLDCDILFDTPNWIEAADGLLDRYPIIQLFRQVHDLGPQWAPGRDRTSEVEFTRPSAAFTIASGVPAATALCHLLDTRIGTCATGFAWAARREFLDQHFFFDTYILGAGDQAMACAAYRCFNELMQRYYMNDHQRRQYITWAEPFYESVRAELPFVNAEIFHFWHGDVGRRKGRLRYEGFQGFQFDPYTDIAINQNGAWRWNTDKPEMHEYVRSYFASRKEDG